jgi:hypothetical protein
MGEDNSLPTPSMESISSQHVLVDLSSTRNWVAKTRKRKRSKSN